MVTGIDQSPGDEGAKGLQDLGKSAITAFPYAGAGKLSGASDVMLQGMGLYTDGLDAALNAIWTAAQDPGPINVFAFSGGAQAITSAISRLPSDITSRINNITYISPGSGQPLSPLATGNGTTTVFYSEGLTWDKIVVGGVPTTAVQIPEKCGHSANCVIEQFSALLETLKGIPCSKPEIITSNAWKGRKSDFWDLFLMRWNPYANSPFGSMILSTNDLVPVVTSTINFGQRVKGP